MNNFDKELKKKIQEDATIPENIPVDSTTFKVKSNKSAF